MKNKELTMKECMEIFKKYDKNLYDYYDNQAYFFGCDAKNYARYLMEKNKNQATDKNGENL